jgi:hypothetical protein
MVARMVETRFAPGVDGVRDRVSGLHGRISLVPKVWSVAKILLPIVTFGMVGGGLLELSRKKPPRRRPLVTTLSKTDLRVLDGVEVEFVPTSLHCYTVSRNLLDPD